MAPKLKSRTYRGETINVNYDIRRCIHAEACIRHLAAVFDTQKRPWIQPDEALTDRVAETVMRCPSGALHYEHLAGGPQEAPPAENTIVPAEDGPLFVHGEVTITNTAGEQVYADTRLALCRCGASANKPFCDNAHLKIEFKAPATSPEQPGDNVDTGARGVLKITPEVNGPYSLHGNFELQDSAGRPLFRSTSAALCRCGGSQRKPFCDGSHRAIGFAAESW